MARTEYRGPGSAFSGSVGKFMSASKRVIKKDSLIKIAKTSVCQSFGH